MYDYLSYNLYGTYDKIKSYKLINDCYRLFHNVNCHNLYFMLNVQLIEQTPVLDNHIKNVVISFHTENLNYKKLIEYFNYYSSKNFLLLSDSDLHENFWPNNVTYVKWISWGAQLDNAILHHNIADCYTKKTLKLSCLNFRRDWHRAAITGYLLKNFSADQRILSWHNNPSAYQHKTVEPIDYYCYLAEQLAEINFDQFLPTQNKSPMINGNWHNPAYLTCLFNLTNESFFDSWTTVDDLYCLTPTPYLTEKTWKPLLAGQALLPVGQVGTINNLEKLGLIFDYSLDLSYDAETNDFDRILKIYSVIDHINNTDILDLEKNIILSVEHNLNIIRSGQFKKNCETINLENFEKIKQWIDQAHSA